MVVETLTSPLGTATRSSQLRYGFRTAGMQMVPAQQVLTEVVNDARVYRVPKTASALAGMINLRGTLIPIFDIETRTAPASDIRPLRMRVLVFGRDASRMGIVIKDDPVILSLLEAPHEVTRPLTHLEKFLVRAWVQEDLPEKIWWEFDHQSALASLTGVE